MARTTGPLMSLSASGSVAKTLTYAHWKGRPYVRQLVTPSNPRSQGQFYTRAMMAFLAQAWANIPSPFPLAQADWDTLAKQGNFSGFNAYVKTNMKRWTQGQGPIVSPNTAGGNTADTFTTFTPTGGVRQITLTITPNVQHDGFAYAIAVDINNSATPALTLTRIIPAAEAFSTTTTREILIPQLTPGTYSLGLFQTTTDGTILAPSNVAQGLIVT